jgi:glutathione S-transferase
MVRSSIPCDDVRNGITNHCTRRIIMPTLYIGDRNYSSWSLRPWLVLKWSGIAFTEHLLSLDQPGYGEGQIAAVREVSPSGRVPALTADNLVIWDSLAIAEWVAEQASPGMLWPTDSARRALARAATCEMHSSFNGVRRDLSMNIRRRCTAKDLPRETLLDIERLDALWSGLRQQFAADGPHLLGSRSIADAFYTPVATRMRTYGIQLSATAQQYCATLLADAAYAEWERLAAQEWKAPFTRGNTEQLFKN